MPKTSDLAGNKKRPRWLSPARLARLQGCSERTIREWCKQGLIQEASQTQGGHWRIRMPLSVKTRFELEKRSGDWPFDDNAGDWQGEWTDDFAEWLMLAQLYQRDLEEGVPVPGIAELGDPVWQEIEQSTDPRAKMAKQIQNKIIQRLESGKPLWDLVVKGWVYQIWLRNERLPTVEEVAEVMELSRAALYYRGYNAKKLAEVISRRLAN